MQQNGRGLRRPGHEIRHGCNLEADGGRDSSLFINTSAVQMRFGLSR